MKSRVTLKIGNIEELYNSIKTKIDITTASNELLDKLSLSNFKNSLVDIVPQCACGSMRGTIFLHDECLECGTKVTDYIGVQAPILWIGKINGYKFITPQFWYMMNNLIKIGNFDSMAYLTNKRYKSPLVVPKILNEIISNIDGFKRNYSYVVENIEKILIFLSNSGTFYQKRHKVKALHQLYIKEKKNLVSSVLPIPNKNIFIIEDSNFNSKKTNIVTSMIKSLIINFRDAIHNGVAPDIIISKLISELTTVYSNNVTDLVVGKSSLVRSSIFGTRVPGSFRTVMMPITGPHHYEDFHMPWVEAVILFNPHLMSKLLDLGYTYINANIHLDRHLYVYDKLIHELLLEILNDAKKSNGKGICLVMQRNPSQHRSSIITLWCNHIKIDPMDFSSNYSMLICDALNADFDGEKYIAYAA